MKWLIVSRSLWFRSRDCLCLFALSAAPALADVKTRDKGQVKFEGMLGTMMRMFGGKALGEGIVSTNAVKGGRKATINDTTGRIVDLGEQKVYDLDMKRPRSPPSTSCAASSARRRTAAGPRMRRGKRVSPRSHGQREQYEFDFDVKETGQTHSIAGFDTRQVVMTVTVREKGKTLDGAAAWCSPPIPGSDPTSPRSGSSPSSS